jgi:hypothetical protein
MPEPGFPFIKAHSSRLFVGPIAITPPLRQRLLVEFWQERGIPEEVLPFTRSS